MCPVMNFCVGSADDDITKILYFDLAFDDLNCDSMVRCRMHILRNCMHVLHMLHDYMLHVLHDYMLHVLHVWSMLHAHVARSDGTISLLHVNQDIIPCSIWCEHLERGGGILGHPLRLS